MESWYNQEKYFLETDMGTVSMMWMRAKGKGYSDCGIACWL